MDSRRLPIATNTIDEIDRLKVELDDLRPLSPDAIGRLAQKLRIEWNYHSNAIEGNTLTLGETRTLILHGLTARGKPMRDHLDIEGHDDAVKAIEEAVEEDHALNQAFVRNLHRILLREPYEMPADTPDGRQVMRPIAIGQYKDMPNNVRTRTGEMHYFAPPEQVQSMMSDLIDWTRTKDAEGEHPIVIAATFHYRFVQIHPFDDGNGRMARLLMNLILMRHGYTIAMVQRDGRDRYIAEIEQAQATGSLVGFIQYIAECCQYGLELHLRAARGESVEEPDDIDREIAVFKRSMVAAPSEGDVVQAQLLVADVIFPLHKHFQDKLKLLATFFSTSSIAGRLTVVGTKGEPQTITLPFTGEIADLFRNVLSLRVSLFAVLEGFRASSRNVFLEIERTTDGKWIFEFGGAGVSAEQELATVCVGDDLGELKKCVNVVIRHLMTVLKQLYDESRSQVSGEPA